jgi:beta-glucanase (GH16 family)
MHSNFFSPRRPYPRSFAFAAPFLALALSFLLLTVQCRADADPSTLDLVPHDAPQNIKPSDPAVATSPGNDGGFVVTIQPGEAAFPGISLKPTNEFYDLSAYGYVEAKVTNPNSDPLGITLRVDNKQRGTFWINEGIKIPPGQTQTVRAYLSKPVDGFDPSQVTEILLFIGKVAGAAKSFQVESVIAGGKPGDEGPANPMDARLRPPDGVLYAAGAAVEPSQLAGKGGGGMSFDHGVLQATFPASAAPDAVAMFRPPVRAWDLRDKLEVHVSLKNDGAVPVTPSVRFDSTYGPTDTIAAPAPVAPGAEVELIVPFIALKPCTINSQDEKELPTSKNIVEGSGNSFLSNSTMDLAISAQPQGAERKLTVTSIRADVPVSNIPDSVGKSPPVDGDWVQTFDDEFPGNSIDATKWNVKGDNWYDAVSHYSAENVIVGGGAARIRDEKKTGFQNDDPTNYQTNYASGYLDTFDKFAQRYGYFECRVKLPQASGLWPAFWLMPDRPGTERKGIRGSTADGGMEFDILEHLSVWGPYRYNVAMHWDGYGKDHKATGSKIYFQPDKDGYVTAGLLWTPGSAVFYANGAEVLRFDSPRVASVPENIILNMAIGGWDNNHLDPKNLQLPADFIINYVRVWQRRDLASDVDSINIAAPAK